MTTTSQHPHERLLTAGLIAGPLFGIIAAAQVVARDGFDLSRHPLSLLSLGDAGWIQITNFIVTGVLVAAFAVGLRAVMRNGPGRAWAPMLIGGHGVGLIVAGLFTAEPSMGFPAGAPEGAPDNLSGHAIVHGVGFAVAFLSLTAATIVLARRFHQQGRHGWMAYTIATAIAAAALAGWPSQDGASVRYAIASAITFTWLAALAATADHTLRAGHPIRQQQRSTV